MIFTSPPRATFVGLIALGLKSKLFGTLPDGHAWESLEKRTASLHKILAEHTRR